MIKAPGNDANWRSFLRPRLTSVICFNQGAGERLEAVWKFNTSHPKRRLGDLAGSAPELPAGAP